MRYDTNNAFCTSVRPSDPERELSHIRLATALLRRSKETAYLTDLDVAIRLYEQALDFLPSGDSGRSTTLRDLAKALRLRHTLTEDDMDLKHALAYEREAWNLCPSSLAHQVTDQPSTTSEVHAVTPSTSRETENQSHRERALQVLLDFRRDRDRLFKVRSGPEPAL